MKLFLLTDSLYFYLHPPGIHYNECRLSNPVSLPPSTAKGEPRTVLTWGFTSAALLFPKPCGWLFPREASWGLWWCSKSCVPPQVLWPPHVSSSRAGTGSRVNPGWCSLLTEQGCCALCTRRMGCTGQQLQARGCHSSCRDRGCTGQAEGSAQRPKADSALLHTLP